MKTCAKRKGTSSVLWSRLKSSRTERAPNEGREKEDTLNVIGAKAKHSAREEARLKPVDPKRIRGLFSF